MRFEYSEKVDRLREIVEPYLDRWAQLKSDAPEHIKETYKELMDLMDKEYEEASL